MHKYTEAIIITLILLCVLITTQGWINLSRYIDDLRNEIQAIKNTPKKQQSLPLGRAPQQAKSIRLSVTPGIHQGHLKSLIRATLSYFNVEEKALADWTRLLLLTSIAESDKGRLLKQVKGPARGIMMVEPATERDTLNWLKACKPDLYSKIKDIRVPAKLEVHECEYNLSYNIALSYSVYLMRKVNPCGKDAKQLAEIYKMKYNTIYGKASVDGVLKKVNLMNIKI